MRPEKKSIYDEISARVNDSEYLLVAEYQGLKVEQISDLRRQLRKEGARMQVVKNRLVRLIAREKGWEKMDPSLKGQLAIVTGKNVVQAAKTLKMFNGASGMPQVKVGYMGNVYLSAAQIDALAELPPREVLLGQVVGTIAAPLSRLVGVLNQKVLSVVYVLKAIENKKNEAK
jgi:large subunit ribosomal protein L10